MVQQETRLKVADNTGAKEILCIRVMGLSLIHIYVENNVILVKGAVPGPKKSLVTLKETVKASK